MPASDGRQISSSRFGPQRCPIRVARGRAPVAEADNQTDSTEGSVGHRHRHHIGQPPRAEQPAEAPWTPSAT